jgi:glutathione peroxidase-family protein/catechol 2,3-dioxygenase-like lactoylglutathione lyase family enzyme
MLSGKRILVVLAMLALGWASVARVAAKDPPTTKLSGGSTKDATADEERKGEPEPSVPAALRFKMKDIDGKEVELKQFLGSVVLIVNTASNCGLTPQYAELQQLHEKYQGQGLVILGFPSNEFGGQEPGSNPEIKRFCTDQYKVGFRLFEKVQVKTPETACDLYKFLTDKKTNDRCGGDIQWNFTKFLIDRRGEVSARFEPREQPTSGKVIAKIEALLKEPTPKGTADSPADDKQVGAAKESDNQPALVDKDAEVAEGTKAHTPASGDARMKLGKFSVSLAVKDLSASRAFYEKLGFHARGGDPKKNWLILQNETTTIGLFQGMFDKNTLTFNPGWDSTGHPLADFQDVREIQRVLKGHNLALASAADEASTGPAFLMLFDPDGNPILIDQHVPSPKQ